MTRTVRSIGPSGIAYDPTTALVVVDVQNDFADRRGSLHVQGAEAILPLVNAEIAAAHAGGALVVLTADRHPAHTPHFAPDGGPWPVHCVAGGWGARFHRRLATDGAVVVPKGEGQEDGYSGMTVRLPDGSTRPTALPGLLGARGIRRVAVCGLATDYCVEATATDIAATGRATIVLLDAIAAVDLAPGDGDRALGRMARAGCAFARTHLFDEGVA